MPVEVEARFSAAGPEPLAHLAAAASLGAAILGHATTFDEIDRYLDTEAGALATVGWACRLRSRGRATRVSLKGPPGKEAGGRDWLHRRPEVEGPANEMLDPGAWPPSDAQERLIDLTGGTPLRERFRLLQQRTERNVMLRGRHIGTLSLDEVQAEGDDHHTDAFHVVELELVAHGSADHAMLVELDELAATLAEIPGLSPEPRTKLEHALDLLGRGSDDSPFSGIGR